jgi:hypothetical protein
MEVPQKECVLRARSITKPSKQHNQTANSVYI